MKCIPVTDEMDVCVTVRVKMIYKSSPTGELDEELLRKDTKLKADDVGHSFEGDIAETIKVRLLES
ncbi:hypothetical protein D3OALGA1CA_858 [Olavius algarvensis associated proteobacterium Delta 3]|nr:hypothetical protein D3OALGA1CA_858 [Olavius algarvensis associated proteobacterium Delta 3]CAB5143241.1 hypothetical protein D3OALGB2SA_4361 [Olavius algarvensis associated proteobacterium Delta 3]